jgi:hypothetical protein
MFSENNSLLVKALDSCAMSRWSMASVNNQFVVNLPRELVRAFLDLANLIGSVNIAFWGVAMCDILVSLQDHSKKTLTKSKFKFKFVQIVKSCPIPPCEETSISSIQVVSSKNIFMNITTINNFGEFLVIFQNHLMPLKFQTKFKFGYLLDFLIQSLPNLRLS